MVRMGSIETGVFKMRKGEPSTHLVKLNGGRNRHFRDRAHQDDPLGDIALSPPSPTQREDVDIDPSSKQP